METVASKNVLTVKEMLTIMNLLPLGRHHSQANLYLSSLWFHPLVENPKPYVHDKSKMLFRKMSFLGSIIEPTPTHFVDWTYGIDSTLVEPRQ
jgi:hypothetical protein